MASFVLEGDGCNPGMKCLESKMLGLSALNGCASFFPNMIILLLLYFTSCHPPHSLPVLPCLPPPLWCFQRRKKFLRTRKKIQVQFVLFIYSLEHAQPPSGQPLTETETFPSHTSTRGRQLWSTALQHPYHKFREFSLVVSFLGFSFAGRVGVVMEAFSAEHL